MPTSTPVRRILLFFVLLLLPLPAAAQEKIDLEVLNRIRHEGLNRSEVMETLRHLTDDIGPRLTGSPQMKEANEWTRKTLAKWGLAGAHLEGYEFGRGWSFSRASVHMLKPHRVPLLALPTAWTPGTEGRVHGQAMRVELKSPEDLEKYKGKVKGKILFLDAPFDFAPPDKVFRRYDDDELAELETFPIRGGGRHSGWKERYMKRHRFRKPLAKFFAEEKPLALVRVSSRDGGLLRLGGRSHKVGETTAVTEIVMAPEHYNRILRFLDDGKEVELEVEIEARFHDDDTQAYNTIAEIPGTSKRAQLVMVGAHLDSWHGGTGAVDNAAGCAVAMEAVRILKAVGARPARTIRIALWSGEEQGLYGSREYVKRHFATRPEPKDPKEKKLPRFMRKDQGWPIKPRPKHRSFSAYFNLDNGGGRIRGIYAEGNAALKPIFEAWFAPLEDLGTGTVSLRGSYGTDHQSFTAVGLPGFQFIQDGLDYWSRAHHTNVDVYDHAIEADLKQASVIMAAFLYQAATRPRLLPRNPMPKKPRQKKQRKRGPGARHGGGGHPR